MLGALCAALTFCATAAIPPSEQVIAVEFYHAAFDHYFISADPKEINDLDTGVHTGWARTGYSFAVMKSGSTYPGTSPMCRFYSPILDTHFYSARPQECEDVKVEWPQTWTLESAEVFRAFLVDPFTGACPADTTPTYRLYNNRADANHRYSDQLSVFVFMKGKGYVPEGDGSPAIPVAFCTPSGADAVPAASATAPTCTSREQRLACAGIDAHAHGQLHERSDELPVDRLHEHAGHVQHNEVHRGMASYTLYAANAQGPADPVTINVNWSGGGAVPICKLTASTLAPIVNTSLTLSASCNQGPDELRMGRMRLLRAFLLQSAAVLRHDFADLHPFLARHCLHTLPRRWHERLGCRPARGGPGRMAQRFEQRQLHRRLLRPGPKGQADQRSVGKHRAVQHRRLRRLAGRYRDRRRVHGAELAAGVRTLPAIRAWPNSMVRPLFAT